MNNFLLWTRDRVMSSFFAHITDAKGKEYIPQILNIRVRGTDPEVAYPASTNINISKKDKKLYMQRLVPNYDLVICFYSLDLFFKTKMKAYSLFNFLKDYLRPGGFFIGRAEDSSTLLQWFVDSDIVIKGNHKLMYRPEPSDTEFGRDYAHYIDKKKNIKYMTNIKLLEQMGDELGFIYLGTYDISDLYNEYIDEFNGLKLSDKEVSMLSQYFAFYKPIVN